MGQWNYCIESDFVDLQLQTHALIIEAFIRWKEFHSIHLFFSRIYWHFSQYGKYFLYIMSSCRPYFIFCKHKAHFGSLIKALSGLLSIDVLFSYLLLSQAVWLWNSDIEEQTIRIILFFFFVCVSSKSLTMCWSNIFLSIYNINILFPS